MGDNDLHRTDADASQLRELVQANHILYDHGVIDAFGHVSVRHGRGNGKFLLLRNLAPGLATVADILEYDLDGTPLNAAGRTSVLERFLHAEIYRARADVQAVVHSHSNSVIPFTASSVALQPLFHMGGFLADVARHDLRNDCGDGTDLLIRDGAKGRYLAAALGAQCVCLMRGHGAAIVGRDLREAVYRGIYTELNARIQMQAIGLGGTVEYLSAAEARAATETLATQYERCWTLWADESDKRRT